ncbi:11910_t:CDS:2 [Ambispora gerdemannii]|uniref:11910_t:CDS:1 n=1 Tax=Ambispora gerdemannii TaxID=144530 RepID=A0A9N9BPP6_9GLOM|nr:11910_t:CDS:2 [Ambispora gerdemannii]
MKAVVRVPHRIRGETTHDTEFDDLNARFSELSKKTERLHSDAVKFRDAVSGMLNYQANFAELIEEVYSPVTGGIASEAGTTRRVQTPVQSMKAASEFFAIMTEIRDTILPELELIDRRVIQPTGDFLTIIKLISKTITKRDHKRIDFDRHRSSVRKIRDKRDKSLSDEKNLYKLEEQLDTATKDYDYFNDLLKKDLPQFFEYRTQFIEPIFEEFYHMQMKIYGLLLDRMNQLVDTGYFDVNSDIMNGFDERRGDIQEKMEVLTLLGRRAKHEERRNSSNSADLQVEQSQSRPLNSRSSGSSKTRITNEELIDEVEEYDHEDDVPPPYTASPTNYPSRGINNNNESGTTTSRVASLRNNFNNNDNNSSNAKSASAATIKPKKLPPPRPPTKPAIKYVIALYDYDAQADGDLTFKKDDRIQLVERTEDKNDWWTGRLNGVVGVFPGNYVEEL